MSNRREEIYQFLPLQEPTLIILLSLADGEKHGYAILKDVAEISNGKVRLSTGTLYEALARLLDQGLIERVTDLPKEVRENKHPGRLGKRTA
jgi:DNA-binding PadR family transcriptional regulator